MPKEKRKNRGGRPAKHGGYSLVAGNLAQQYPHLQQYLREVREGLIEHLGGEDKLTTPQELLVNSIVSKLTITRLIEIFVERTSPFDLEQLKHDPAVLVLQPALGISYLSFCNSIDKALERLGLRKEDLPPKDIDLVEYVEQTKAGMAENQARTSQDEREGAGKGDGGGS